MKTDQRSINADRVSLGGFVMMFMAWGLWAIDPILIYQIGSSVSRTLLAGISMLIAGLLFAPSLFNAARLTRQLPARHFVMIMIQVVFFTAISGVCYVSAVRYMNPGLVNVVLRTQIVFAVVFAIIYFGERLGRMAVAGILLILLANFGILAGALLSGPEAHTSAIGWTLAFLAALLNAGGTLTGKELLKTFTPKEVVAVRMTLAGALTLVFHLCSEGVASLLALTQSQWLLLVIKGVLTAGCAFLLYYSALKHMKIYVASAMETFSPLLTISVAYFFLGKTITRSDVVSVAVLLTGTAVVIAGTIGIGRKNLIWIVPSYRRLRQGVSRLRFNLGND